MLEVDSSRSQPLLRFLVGLCEGLGHSGIACLEACSAILKPEKVMKERRRNLKILHGAIALLVLEDLPVETFEVAFPFEELLGRHETPWALPCSLKCSGTKGLS